MTDRDEQQSQVGDDDMAVRQMLDKVRDLVDDTGGETHLGEKLNTLECFCGAKRGEDYHKYCYHLATHSPEDFGLGGGRCD